jgi:hypothetical protein
MRSADVKKGTEYEYDHDFGTMARVEGLFPARASNVDISRLTEFRIIALRAL